MFQMESLANKIKPFVLLDSSIISSYVNVLFLLGSPEKNYLIPTTMSYMDMIFTAKDGNFQLT